MISNTSLTPRPLMLSSTFAAARGAGLRSEGVRRWIHTGPRHSAQGSVRAAALPGRSSTGCGTRSSPPRSPDFACSLFEGSGTRNANAGQRGSENHAPLHRRAASLGCAEGGKALASSRQPSHQTKPSARARPESPKRPTRVTASPPQALPAGRSGPPSRAPKDDLCPRRRPFASLPFPSSSPSSRPAALTMNAAEPHRPRRRSPMPVPLRDLAPRRGAARARTASRAARPAPPAPLISCGAAAADRFSLSRPALPEHAWRRGGPGRVRRFHARFPGRRAPASAGRAHLAVGLRKLRAASLLLSALFGQLHKVHRHGPCCYPRVCSRSSPRCSGPHAARGLHRGPTLSQNEQHGYPEYNRSCLSILLLRISTNSPYFLLNWATKTVKGLEYLSVRTGESWGCPGWRRDRSEVT